MYSPFLTIQRFAFTYRFWRGPCDLETEGERICLYLLAILRKLEPLLYRVFYALVSCIGFRFDDAAFPPLSIRDEKGRDILSKTIIYFLISENWKLRAFSSTFYIINNYFPFSVSEFAECDERNICTFVFFIFCEVVQRFRLISKNKRGGGGEIKEIASKNRGTRKHRGVKKKKENKKRINEIPRRDVSLFPRSSSASSGVARVEIEMGLKN